MVGREEKEVSFSRNSPVCEGELYPGRLVSYRAGQKPRNTYQGDDDWEGNNLEGATNILKKRPISEKGSVKRSKCSKEPGGQGRRDNVAAAAHTTVDQKGGRGELKNTDTGSILQPRRTQMKKEKG